MDALPAEDTDRDLTATPSSSTTSLPHTAETEHHPAPQQPSTGATGEGSVAFANPQPVGLGLPTYIGGTGRADWPVVRDITDEIDSDLEDDADGEQQEMETYQSTYRAPVDATLRSMPGVVALGDGWASGSQSTPKKRWFRRTKNEEPAPAEDDPLALWHVPPTPTVAANDSMVTPTTATDPNAKWWRSRKNLFASQRAINSPTTEGSGFGSAEPKSSPAGKSRAGWVNRSRLNFGSMVDLGRSSEKRKTTAAQAQVATPTLTSFSFGPDQSTPTPKAKPFARHSMGGLMRKAPPHPLELSHQKDPAARSQPVMLSASSSQPSFFPSPSLEHPLLRMSYARSESHLADGGSPGIPPPRPVVDNGPLKGTSPMPSWRPPRLSPTTLLEVEEEDEEDEPSGRPPLKRTATFGDDEEPAPHQQQRAAPTVSQAPALATVEGSPHEPSRTLSSGDSTNESNRPPSSLLGRIKNALNRGRGRNSPTSRKAASIISASTVPESPRSVLSEQPLPTTPTRASLLPPPRSVGHQGVAPPPHRRSRLWSRAGRDADKDFGLATKASNRMPASRHDKRSYRVSKHVVESMINLSPSSNNMDTFGRESLNSSNSSPNPAANRRTSWAAPIPSAARLSEEDEGADTKAERRHSRVSLRRFKSQSKQRPGLGAVFPRPPDSVEHPPSLHWAFPGSYSTPMLHKFGGSTLSLALDISSTADNGMSLDDIQESPRSPRRPTYNDDGRVSPATQRERAISATIASLTGRSPVTSEPPVRLQGVQINSRGHRNSIPVNMDNLTNSSDSLALPSVNNTVNFPLPPSSSGEISSPDPDQIEQLRTPHDGDRQYTGLDYYRHSDEASDESTGSGSTGSGSSRRLRKAPSWSTCKTSSASAAASLTPIATPTSTSSQQQQQQQQQSTYQTARGSFSSSLLNDATQADDAAYMIKAASMASSRRPIVA